MARDVAILGVVRSGERARKRRRLRPVLAAQVLVIAWVVTGAVWLPEGQGLAAVAVGAVLFGALCAMAGSRSTRAARPLPPRESGGFLFIVDGEPVPDDWFIPCECSGGRER